MEIKLRVAVCARASLILLGKKQLCTCTKKLVAVKFHREVVVNGLKVAMTQQGQVWKSCSDVLP